MSNGVRGHGPVEEEEDDDIQTLQFKVILLGDGAVGKTSIATRFAEDRFSQTYKQTVGVDFFVKRIDLPPNIQITLQIWDIGGQSIGSRMLRSYVAGADAIMFCYDITNRESFSNIEDWLRLSLQACEGKERPYMCLVANKSDLRHLSVVSSRDHAQLAEENGLATLSLSAKSGDMVRQAFTSIAAALSGISYSRVQAEAQTTVIPAMIVDHKQHDEKVNNGQVPNYTGKDSGLLNCTIC